MSRFSATKELESYKEERRPVFKSSTAQFMTTIYSMEFEEARKDASNVSSVLSNVPSNVLSREQVWTKSGLSWDQVEKILMATSQPISAGELMKFAKQRNRTRFKKNYLDPLLNLGIIAMTQPDSPKSPTQKYYLTELGKALLENE